MNIFKWIFNLIIPNLCPICRQSICQHGDNCCATCRRQIFTPRRRCWICGGENHGHLDCCPNCLLEEVRPWLHGVTAFNYDGCICEAIQNFKYNGQTYLAKFFAENMYHAWQMHGDISRPEIIVPVPLHWTRLLLRGYNQAELLCRHLSKQMHLPTICALKRCRATGHQARKSGRERRKNLISAFKADKRFIDSKRVLLVDDVMTTGATLTHCAQALLAAGASEISVLTIARR